MDFGTNLERPLNFFFIKGDFVGIGLVNLSNFSLGFFGTFNGKLLGITILIFIYINKSNSGKVELPIKYPNVFPAISLFGPGDLIGVNFDKNKWKFKEFKHIFE